jgi:hypothetical protein
MSVMNVGVRRNNLLRPSWLAALLLAALASACGNTSRDPGQAAGNTNGTSGAASDADAANGADAAVACQDGYTVRWQVGVPEAEGEACLDNDEPELIELCVAVEERGAPWYDCYRRLADGRQFWLDLPGYHHPDFAKFELCELVGATDHPMPPPPCFVASCPEPLSRPIVSTCSVAETERAHGCGAAGSPWDEDCCLRTQCHESADVCADDEECREAVPLFQNCSTVATQDGSDWVADPSTCVCGGRFDGFGSLHCFPRN